MYGLRQFPVIPASPPSPAHRAGAVPRGGAGVPVAAVPGRGVPPVGRGRPHPRRGPPHPPAPGPRRRLRPQTSPTPPHAAWGVTMAPPHPAKLCPTVGGSTCLPPRMAWTLQRAHPVSSADSERRCRLCHVDAAPSLLEPSPPPSPLPTPPHGLLARASFRTTADSKGFYVDENNPVSAALSSLAGVASHPLAAGFHPHAGPRRHLAWARQGP